MFLIAGQVSPRPARPHYGQSQRVVAVVFVVAADAAVAQTAALARIEQDGWDIDEVFFARPVEREETPPESIDRTTFDAAVQRGIASRYQEFPFRPSL
jgi:hypothetical protein